jgi:hypothetical protein
MSFFEKRLTWLRSRVAPQDLENSEICKELDSALLVKFSPNDVSSPSRRNPTQDQGVSANLPIFNLSGFSADENPEGRLELCAKFKNDPLSIVAGQRAGG